jgi:uncharacterized LabA/DUF88 family protein
MNRVSFFIDGFNVYHALDSWDQNKKYKPYNKYKWLDYSALARCFTGKADTITDIYYFTAYAEWSKAKVDRHELLIRALTMNGVKIVLGKFKLRDKECQRCHKIYQTYEEKQTDVNISIMLFQCAHNDTFDKGILISGDSDIIPAIKSVKETFPQKQVGLVIPIGRRSEEMKNVCNFHMKMKEAHLKNSQFPDKIIIGGEKNITLERPSTWI